MAELCGERPGVGMAVTTASVFTPITGGRGSQVEGALGRTMPERTKPGKLNLGCEALGLCASGFVAHAAMLPWFLDLCTDGTGWVIRTISMWPMQASGSHLG